jgi:hypothetical protein
MSVVRQSIVAFGQYRLLVTDFLELASSRLLARCLGDFLPKLHSALLAFAATSDLRTGSGTAV